MLVAVSLLPATCTVMANEDASTSIEAAAGASDVSVSYTAHVQNIGWQSAVKDGETAGTSGQSLRVEALQITLDNQSAYTGSIEYRGHVQNIGWQDYVSDGETAGTDGQSLRVEALQIRLTGELAEHYDVYYRVHVQNIGWMTWVKNDAIAGTSGQSLRIEALQIKIFDKSAESSDLEAGGVIYAEVPDASALTYSAHVQNIGDQAAVSMGDVCGTSGLGYRLEGIIISLDNSKLQNLSGTIEYRTHVQNIGWTNWVSSGTYSGSRGRSYRLEALEIRLTGDLERYYDVYYTTHIENYGWLGWACNGQTAGSTGISYRMEALKITLVPKGSVAPGSTTGYCKTQVLAGMNATAQRYRSATNYLIICDTRSCMTIIYTGCQGDWTQIMAFPCGPGAVSSPTVKGEFTVTGRGRAFGTSAYTCYYYTQFYGNYLFHSVLYYPGTMNVKDPTVGRQVSHGCVRLQIENALWIYQNIPNGTKVVVF